ncbi:amidase domain-containing protein [Arcanobacterium ihumii]
MVRSAVPSFNVNAAVNYAMAYAATPNYANYRVFDNDRINFASQILAAGG